MKKATASLPDEIYGKLPDALVSNGFTFKKVNQPYDTEYGNEVVYLCIKENATSYNKYAIALDKSRHDSDAFDIIALWVWTYDFGVWEAQSSYALPSYDDIVPYSQQIIDNLTSKWNADKSTRKAKKMRKEEKKIPIADDDAVEIEEEDGKKVVEIESKEEHDEEVQSGEESSNDDLNADSRKSKKNIKKSDDEQYVYNKIAEIYNLCDDLITRLPRGSDSSRMCIEGLIQSADELKVYFEQYMMNKSTKKSLIKQLDDIVDDEKHGCNCKAKRKWFAKEEEPESEDDELKSRKGYIRRARKGMRKGHDMYDGMKVDVDGQTFTLHWNDLGNGPMDTYSVEDENGRWLACEVNERMSRDEVAEEIRYVVEGGFYEPDVELSRRKSVKKSEERYQIRARESGDVINMTDDFDEALGILNTFEEYDKKDNMYTPDFYEIYDTYNEEIVESRRKSVRKADSDATESEFDEVTDGKKIDSGKDIADEEKNCVEEDVDDGEEMGSGNDIADEEKSALLDDVESPKAKRKSVKKSESEYVGFKYDENDGIIYIYMERDGEERTQLISANEGDVEALEDGVDPIADGWEDGNGNPVGWEFAKSTRKSVRKFSVTTGGGEKYDGREKYDLNPMMRECVDREFGNKDLVKSLNDRIDALNGQSRDSTRNKLGNRKIRY